jgi:hypothetical protein
LTRLVLDFGPRQVELARLAGWLSRLERVGELLHSSCHQQ